MVAISPFHLGRTLRARQTRPTWVQCAAAYHKAARNTQKQDLKVPLSTEVALDRDIRALTRSPSGNEPAAWLKLLSKNVPSRFQSSSPLAIYRPDPIAPPIDATNFLSIMEKGRTHADIDLLRFLGPSEGRWRSLRWMIEVLIAECEKEHESGSYQKKEETTMVKEHSLPSMRKLTNDAISQELQEELLTSSANLYRDEGRNQRDRAFSQIWQSLGSLVLQAESRREDREAYKNIMLNVLYALGEMHHKGLFPKTIYNYDTARDSSAVQRPPTLWLLSSRIMSQLSDVAWNRQYLDALAKAEEQGYELTVPMIQPSFQSVGTEIWLELILWACVEGGWISEAAWIISELESSGMQAQKGWSVIDWPELCRIRPPTLDWAAALRLQLDRSRLDQYTGISIADGDVSNVDMGARTISVEVVLAVVDGLVNKAGATSIGSPTSIAKIQGFIVSCKRLLRRGGVNFDPEFMNAVLLRLIDTAGKEIKDNPHQLESLIRLSPILENAHRPNEDVLSAIDQSPIDPSASVLGYLHRNLEIFAATDNAAGVTRTLESISNVHDANKNIYIQEFANDLRTRGSNASETHSTLAPKQAPLLHPQVPIHVLDQLITFVNENQLPGLGDFLFHGNEIEGGFVQPNAFGEPSLQPRLLEYAIGNKDDAVLTGVLEKLEPPFPLPILRALVEYYVSTHRWSAVEEVFQHLSTSSDTSWTANQVMTIASYIIQRSNIDDSEERLNAQNATNVLSDALQGKYDPPRDPTRPVNMSRVQLANQIKRILRSVPGKCFAFLPPDLTREKNRLSRTVGISSKAFGILLQAVVDQFGCHAGRAMWQRWCLAPNNYRSRSTAKSEQLSVGKLDEKPVVSKRQLICTIVRPLLHTLAPEGELELQQLSCLNGHGKDAKADEARYRKAFEALPKKSQGLLRWAAAMSRGPEDKIAPDWS